MARHHMVNNEVVPFTQAEEDARDLEEAAWESKKSERAFRALRSKRNRLLAETDWVVTKAAESKEDIASNMVAYRKALRDLPGTFDNTSILSFDFESGWPTKP